MLYWKLLSFYRKKNAITIFNQIIGGSCILRSVNVLCCLIWRSNMSINVENKYNLYKHTRSAAWNRYKTLGLCIYCKDFGEIKARNLVYFSLITLQLKCTAFIRHPLFKKYLYSANWVFSKDFFVKCMSQLYDIFRHFIYNVDALKICLICIRTA